MSRALSDKQRAKRRRLALRAAAPQGPAKKPQLAIRSLTAVAVQEPVSGRAYLLVSIQTDGAITGIGETRVGAASELAVMKPLLIGQDALAHAALVHRLGQQAKSAQLLPAIQMALLDIMGKSAKAPVHTVLGGPTRNKARALACPLDVTPDKLKAVLPPLYKAGFRAFKVPLPVNPAGQRAPTFARQTLAYLEGLRKALGSEADLVLDGAGRLTPAEAVRLARACERFHVLFLDEPSRQMTPAALRKITDESVVPLGLGQAATDNAVFQEWLREQVVDVLRPDLSQLGMSTMRKAAALAETYYVAVAPRHQAGPVTTAAGLHVAASIPNFFILDVPVPADERDRQMRRELVTTAIEIPRDGFLPLPTAPGLGVDLNQDAVEKYRIK